jgi:hypothetical protein
MFRVNYLHNKGQSESLGLLGSPQVMAVAESLCGMNFVPTYESMVFKEENDGAPIIWHQDVYKPDFSQDRDAELKIAHLVHTSPAFCSAGDVPEKTGDESK